MVAVVTAAQPRHDRAVSVDDAPIGTNENLTELTLFSPAGTVLAAPSALTAGYAFSVTSDGPGPSDSPGPSGRRGTRGGGSSTRGAPWGL